MSIFCFGLPSPFRLGRFFRWDGSVNTGIIEFRIVIPPAVIILFRDLSCFELRGLLLPGTEPLFKIGSLGATVRNLCPQTNQSVSIQNADQLSILQRKQRVHQAVHAVYVRDGYRFGRNVQCFCQLSSQVGLGRAILRFVLPSLTSAELSGKPSISPRYFCVIPRKVRKKRIRSPVAIEITS